MFFNILYLTFLVLASPFYLVSIIRRDKHRIGLAQKLGLSSPQLKPGKRIWLHAVSVGEVLLCRPLVTKLRAERPELNIIISVTTATGYRMAQRHFAEHEIIFYPFDFSWAVKRMLKVVQPEMILLVELELWPNFIRAAKKRNIPVAVINGRLTERSCRGFQRAKRVLAPMFAGVAHYWMQTDLYAERLRKLGIPESKIMNLGSMKYDCLDFEPKSERIQTLIDGLGSFAKRPVIVAGSTHNPEEQYLLDALGALIRGKKVNLIIVPRHPERYDEVEELIKAAGLTAQRKTALDGGQNYCDGAVVMLDTMGELAQVYGIADAVYIGGTLIEHGGQNLMEPAALGKAIICGPSVYNFQETYDLLKKAGATIDIPDAQGLIDECTTKLLQRDLAEIGRRGIEVMRAQAGSTDKHYKQILKALDEA